MVELIFIRKLIILIYKDLWDTTFANETLKRCIGDVDGIRNKILFRNGNRKQRINNFCSFILQEDNDVIGFKKKLESNCLEKLQKK